LMVTAQAISTAKAWNA